MRVVACSVPLVALVAALTSLASCKTNTISVGGGGAAGSGAACDGGATNDCTGGTACILGRCRTECVHDDECEGESVCVGEERFGCTFAFELGCSSSQPCTAPLACDPAGSVGVCRNACKLPADCRLPGYGCVQGVCVPGG